MKKKTFNDLMMVMKTTQKTIQEIIVKSINYIINI